MSCELCNSANLQCDVCNVVLPSIKQYTTHLSQVNCLALKTEDLATLPEEWRFELLTGKTGPNDTSPSQTIWHCLLVY